MAPTELTTNSKTPTETGSKPAEGTVTVPAPSEEVIEAQNEPTLRGFKLYAVTVGVCFGALMISLDVAIIGTAIPSITSDFGDTSQIAWYPAAYTFTTCALTPLAGKMATIFPMNWVYLSFSGIFFIGSIVCGAAPTSNALIAGRAIAGIGAAGVASNGLTVLVTIAPANKKPLFMGLGAGCFGIGLVIAPILSGVFTERLTWRWCFWINLPFVSVTLAVIFFFFKPHQSREGSVISRIRSLDLVGCAVFIPAIFMLLLAMQWGGEEDKWNSATIIGLFVGGGMMLLLFIAWEHSQGDRAMIPGSVVTRRTILFTVLFAFCHMGSFTLASYYLPEWFQAVQGVSPLASGVRMLPTIITQLITTMIASGLAVRIKYYNPWFFLAPIFMGIASGLYTQFTPFSTPSSHWIGFQIIQGIGAGLGMQMSSLAVQLELKDAPDLLPVGIAFVMFLQYLGATVTQVIAGTIFNHELKQQLIGHAGLTTSQTSLLLEGGVKDIRKVTEEYFPELLHLILKAYNSAITKVFFVSVGGAVAAFLLAFGIKWNKIEGPQGPLAKLRASNAAPEGDNTESKPLP